MALKFVIFLLGINICLPGIYAKIVRPCPLTNYECIGDNLSANSQCKLPVKGKLPSKYNVDSFHFETPYFNSSYIDRNLIVRNHDKCFVSEFFINTVTDRAVLALDCPYLDLESDRTYIQHATYQEDSYYYYHIRGTYPLLRITINLPAKNHMNLCNASIFTDVVVLPRLHINPLDKPTDKQLTRDLSHLYIYERENCFYRGAPLAYIFIDALICDYGCPIPN